MGEFYYLIFFFGFCSCSSLTTKNLLKYKYAITKETISTTILTNEIIVPLKPKNLNPIAHPNPEDASRNNIMPFMICENESFIYPISFLTQDMLFHK